MLQLESVSLQRQVHILRSSSALFLKKSLFSKGAGCALVALARRGEAMTLLRSPGTGKVFVGNTEFLNWV